MSLLWIYYHGEVDIAYWEWVLGTVYMVLLYVYFARLKNVAIKKAPEYRHMLWGLFAKALGGVGFSLIYFYYYRGGDTIMYFYSAVAMSNLAQLDLVSYLEVVTGPNDMENLSKFNEQIGYPYGNMYFDSRAYFVIRLISPVVLLTFNSYLITTLFLASISYFGIWRCFRTFVSYFPSLTNKFAIAFLYMPSVVFWGSAIMKDTFTLSATAWWVHCADEVLFKKRKYFYNVSGLIVSAVVLIVMKPYIFMAIFPVTVLWVLYFRVAKIKNALIKFLLLPIALVTMLFGTFFVLNALGDKLDKFSLDKAVETVMVLQSDMKRSEQYGSNYFDIGPMDGTLGNLASKFPVALNAALFRPYIWESKNIVMAISSLENFWLLCFVLLMLWRTRVWFFFRAFTGNPLIMMCFMFAILFGFVIGISTPNFGALVRFKIPMIPFIVAGLYIMNELNLRRLWAKARNRQFKLSDYYRGTPEHTGLPVSPRVSRPDRPTNG